MEQRSVDELPDDQQPHLILDHSHLRPGQKAALLSYKQTLNSYRNNAKKSQDPDTQFEFAVFLIDAAQSLSNTTDPSALSGPGSVRNEEVLRDALDLLKRLADRGHVAAQYFLADCYANGVGTNGNKQDFDRAYPLFVLAAKRGHPDAAYRAGTCCENGWGCRRESPKAVQFFRKAAAASHAGAMYRLGMAELNGELGLPKAPREGIKWLKRSAENATEEFPHALHELGALHAVGLENVVFVDTDYAVELFARGAELGYAPSAYQLGVCYEYGKLGCPRDPTLCVHFYNIAAQQNHRDACFALTSWYLIGSPGVLPQSDTEAYLWAQRAAQAGLVKAMYAVGYFLEVGIGVQRNVQEAMKYYSKAASLGDSRAKTRLQSIGQWNGQSPKPGETKLSKTAGMPDGHPGDSSAKDPDCVIM